MTKLITISSFKKGTGRTSLSCILAQQISLSKKNIFLLDNNEFSNDMEKYLLIDSKYSIDNLKPFIKGKSCDMETIVSLSEKKDNIFTLGGSNIKGGGLNSEEIAFLKTTLSNYFDYILIDSDFEQINFDSTDKIVILSNPSNLEENYIKELIDKKSWLTSLFLKKGILVINRFNDDVEFDDKLISKYFSDVVYINYSSSIMNYCNGYKCNFDKELQEQINRLFFLITGKEINYRNNNIIEKIKGFFIQGHKKDQRGQERCLAIKNRTK